MPAHYVINLLLPCLLLPAFTAAAGDFQMQARPVTRNIYAVIPPTRDLPNPQNRGWNSNSAFVITDEGVLVIDTGSSTALGTALKRTIATVTDQPVRWIINTHAHGDHWLGNAAFTDTIRAIYATSSTRDQIRTQGKNWVVNFKRLTDGATGDSTILPPDTAIDRRTTLQLGGTTVELFPSGDSHSPGDLIVWLPEDRILISGDVVYSDRMPSTNNSNLQHWIKLLPELAQLNPTAVIPGHGSVTNTAGIRRLHELLSTMWQAVEEGFNNGLAAYETVPLVQNRLSRFTDEYPGMEDKLSRDVPRVYLQVEAALF